MIALTLIQKTVAFALLLQTIELLQVRKAFGVQGVWTWRLLKNDYGPRTQNILGFFLNDSHFYFLLWTQFILSLGLLLTPFVLLALPLFLSAFLISLRFRGTYNGGSDSMTILVLVMLSITVLGAGHPPVIKGALWYLAVQTGLSYFLAGAVKARNFSWWSGEALRKILTNSNYAVSQNLKEIFDYPGVPQIFSWIIIFFECSFPLAYFNKQSALIYLGIGFLFHFTNTYILGLNRFFVIWIAAYPAIYYCAFVI